MASQLFAWITVAVWVGGNIFAIVKGGQRERWAGGLLIVYFFSSFFMRRSGAGLTRDVSILAVDIVVLVALGLVAWHSLRSWPMWATAFQAIGLTVDFSLILKLQISRFAEMAANNLAAYGLIVSLIVGTWFAWREREALKPLTQLGPKAPLKL